VDAPAKRVHERIRDEVLSWPGVTEGPHRFGGVEFTLGRRELGHLHGDHTADLPFPRAVHDQLIAEGRANAHHTLPDSGWVTFSIRSEEDVADAVALFRLSYTRAVAARHSRQKPGGEPARASGRPDNTPAPPPASSATGPDDRSKDRTARNYTSASASRGASATPGRPS